MTDASVPRSGRPTIEEVACEAVGWLRTGPEVGRAEWPEAVLVDRPLPHTWYASATRIRFDPGEADAGIARVRGWFAARGRAGFVWMLGPAHTPTGLEDRLLADGARREPGVLTAMVLDREPPAGPAEIDVRPVTTSAEYVLAQEIVAAGFGFSAAEAAAERATDAHAWAHWRSETDRVLLLAWLDGRPIAEAGLAPTLAGPFVLSGGATLPEARGRGAYRALVRFRWEEAARRGAPALVVQASPMSRPILERAGSGRSARSRSSSTSHGPRPDAGMVRSVRRDAAAQIWPWRSA